jgi:hypothetical protein
MHSGPRHSVTAPSSFIFFTQIVMETDQCHRLRNQQESAVDGDGLLLLILPLPLRRESEMKLLGDGSIAKLHRPTRQANECGGRSDLQRISAVDAIWLGQYAGSLGLRNAPAEVVPPAGATKLLAQYAIRRAFHGIIWAAGLNSSHFEKE